jgi:hypothetical protein
MDHLRSETVFELFSIFSISYQNSIPPICKPVGSDLCEEYRSIKVTEHVKYGLEYNNYKSNVEWSMIWYAYKNWIN